MGLLDVIFPTPKRVEPETDLARSSAVLRGAMRIGEVRGDTALRQAEQVVNPHNANEVAPIVEWDVNLITLGRASWFRAAGSKLTSRLQGISLPVAGVELIFRREGSDPGARIDFMSAGKVTALAPGMRVKIPISGGSIRLNEASYAQSSLSGSVGEETPTARFIIVTQVGFEWEENEGSLANTPRSLGAISESWGTPDLQGFAFINKDTVPTGYPSLYSIAGAGSFPVVDVTGWSKMRVWFITSSGTGVFDGAAIGPAVNTFTVIPWYWPQQSTDMYRKQCFFSPFPATNNVISVLDTVPAGGSDRRVLDVDVRGWGFMTFEIRNLLPGTLTGMLFSAQGLY